MLIPTRAVSGLKAQAGDRPSLLVVSCYIVIHQGEYTLCMDVVVYGVSGYAGQQLVGLVASHPELRLVGAVSRSWQGRTLDEGIPGLDRRVAELVVSAPERTPQGEVAYLALPHGESQRLVPELLSRSRLVVDLGADFRFSDQQSYRQWYGVDHLAPELLEKGVSGLVEYNREKLFGASLIAVPGCYPTAVALAMCPLKEVLGPSVVIVDAISGVSGAGVTPTPSSHFGAASESVGAYGVSGHRHTGEMEMFLERPVLFTPHLAPMRRGILATCYGVPRKDQPMLSTVELAELVASRYRDEPFVHVVSEPPATAQVRGSNHVRIHYISDARTGYYRGICVLDNLVKGASGQAIQATNVALGWPEDAGLTGLGVWP